MSTGRTACSRAIPRPPAPATRALSSRPNRSTQLEVGGKLAVNRLLLSAALFEIRCPFAYTNGNGDYAVDGEQRNCGLELMAGGYVV
ncbi:TonB-dependent receptor|nr:TonB-dependent receptor [Candidatus Pantoea persica]